MEKINKDEKNKDEINEYEINEEKKGNQIAKRRRKMTNPKRTYFKKIKL